MVKAPDFSFWVNSNSAIKVLKWAAPTKSRGTSNMSDKALSLTGMVYRCISFTPGLNQNETRGT